MTHKQVEGPGRYPAQAPRHVQLGGSGRGENTRKQHGGQQERHRPISTTTMMQALTAALADTPEHEREELMEWAIHRLFLGVAHQSGCEAAAAIAYRAGDILARGVR
jgi:hypothetical protein